MLVRFGYVAMSTEVKNASPSKTMTVTQFEKITDREAAVHKLERIAAENLHNTLRLLYHNRAHDIRLYRFSSRLVPLWGHEPLKDWDPLPPLRDKLRQIGEYVTEHEMRVSFHPEHFTVLGTPKADVFRKSVEDLSRHAELLEAMGLDPKAKCNIHIGGSYGDKERTMERFLRQFMEVPQKLRERITLENDDKTFDAAETLEACEQLGVPMVADIHHHAVNPGEEELYELWPRILTSWEGSGLAPKIHVSSPKNEQNPRSHADYVEVGFLLDFLRRVAPFTPRLDVMIEAKKKDGALFRLMKDLSGEEKVEVIDSASIQII